MDEFVLSLPGEKPERVQVFFLTTSIYAEHHHQGVTTCILRQHSFTVGIGTTIQSPKDTFNTRTGQREAFKLAAKDVAWRRYRALSEKERKGTKPNEQFWKLLWHAYRDHLRDVHLAMEEAEEEQKRLAAQAQADLERRVEEAENV